MDISNSLPSTPSSLSFSFLTTEDIKRISVKQIVNPILLDNLNRPTVGGLYDPALGPMDSGDVCSTCRLTSYTCPGHFGHISLPNPVFQPLFFTQAYALVRATCMYCHRFRGSEAEMAKFVGRLTLLDHGLLTASLELAKLSASISFATIQPDADDDEEAAAKDALEEKEEKEAESEESFIKRMEDFVRSAIRAGGKQAENRDQYKDGLVFEERKKVIGEFAKKGYKKCQKCKAFAHSYRKEGHTKIVEIVMNKKHAGQMRALGRHRPSLSQVKQLVLSSRLDEVDEGYVAGSGSEDDEGEGDALDVDGDVDMDGEDKDEDANSDEELQRNAVQLTKKPRERVMQTDEARAHLRLLFKNEPVVTSLLYGGHGPFARTMNVANPSTPNQSITAPLASADMFFMDLVPVPPTRFRPAARMGEIVFENPQNELLAKILTTSYRIVDLTKTSRSARHKPKPGEVIGVVMEAAEMSRVYGMLLEALIQLQIDVNSFMDSNKNPTIIRGGKLPPAGVKQGLEKKDGLFRKHMMGKRVNYAARSVISPDINLETNEIGVPPVFARKLTFPEPVTNHNHALMRQAVINGPKIYPGASMVVNPDGSQTSLDKLTKEQRTAIANQLLVPQEGSAAMHGGLSTKTSAVNKKVYRHLRDGDILLLNRQPTLHKPSMMGHRAKVLTGEKTIRMHYANCNSYNADFDGDEMNIHFAQSQPARAEAYNIANTDSQYLVPTSGAPLRGLIQDHVVAGVWMCKKGTFFTREEYHQLIYGALKTENDYCSTKRIRTLPPTIWKPKPLWCGKQLISTLLLNIVPNDAPGLNLVSKNKVKNDLWGPKSQEGEVLFMDGELLIGILDKTQFGASSYGLVHSVFEVYGPETAGKLLSVLSRLFTKYLQSRAFTCRMDDLVLTKEGEAQRREMLKTVDAAGKQTAISYVGLGEDADPNDPEVKLNLQIRLEEILRDDRLMAGLDNVMQARFGGTTTKVNAFCVPHQLVKPFPDNNMQMMTISGAKGSTTNATMISSVLGQQSLEGRRVPTMVSGKTLPSFKPFETNARAGGYVANRFLTGIRPQEYYFHCMSGREGLIDTAVKTSRSGYLQRCLIKHLEGIRVHYDHTVRDSDQSVIQFYYGEDALDVTKQAHLDPKQFAFNIANSKSLLRRYNPKELFGLVDENSGREHLKKAKRKPHKYGPSLEKYSPSRFLGSMGEKYADQLEAYKSDNKDNLLTGFGKKERKEKGEKKLKKGEEPSASPWSMNTAAFQTMMELRYMRAMIDPGEAVGLLAAQGVGEPSTQMTLNTFHLAGHGAANVTLGIPRLRELVMTASANPKTPSMRLPILDVVPEPDLARFVKDAKKVTLSELVDKVTVTERLSSKTVDNGQSRSRTYTVLLDFYPREEYLEEHNLTPHQILESLPSSFGLHVRNEILRELKEVGKMLKNDLEGVGKGKTVRIPRGTVDEHLAETIEEQGDLAGDDVESDAGDGDADDAKRAANSKEVATYDDDESEAGEVGDLEDIEGAFPDDADLDEETSKAQDEATLAARQEEVEAAFIAAARYVSRFSFDVKEGKSCEFDIQFPGDSQKLLIVDVMERCCQKAVIHQIPLISRAIRLKTGAGDDESWKKGKRTLLTEGSNFRAIWEHANEFVDMNYLYSNDIAAILHAYGVEAARASIIAEVSGVFGVYAITINYRHLSLIADYMTHEGGYKPFNRTGISSKSSTLLKASFETTAAFLSEATLHGDFDDLQSPSGNIVMGKPSIIGTAAFDIRTPIEYDTQIV